ncbi:PINIT domain-containing protein [Podospora fimiseda]|uniref:PINIT domain-containing protein n=1 Tax=Podospora fimiseda TaxID=252190 RepID=A0AAN7BYS6_9PEZI|nr:PINIT domain-containing protein [Podospora fimiseda]
MVDKTAEVQALIRTVQIPSIQKLQLQNICQRVSIPKTGNKADLQKRIIEQINIAANSREWSRVDEIRATISAVTKLTITPISQPSRSASTSSSAASLPQSYAQPPRSQGGYYQPIPPNPNQPQYSAMASYGTQGYGHSALGISPRHSGLNGAGRTQHAAPLVFKFKPSPFYEIKRQIDRTKTLEIMTAHRNTVTFEFKASDDPVYQMCASDPAMRVLVFCSENTTSSDQDISFPHQCELRVNSDEIKANHRGLKNKPGSTKPVDVTPALRLRQSNYPNKIEVTYALTQKQFFASVYVARMVPVETLVGQIKKRIRKETVVAEITKPKDDDDIEATSQKLSLKCPLSYMRLKNPCRATSCNHIQCFDATSYLQLQEQGPQWECPICNKPAPYNQLAIDEYVLDIVNRTHEDVEQVTIDTSGQWNAVDGQEEVAVAPTKTEAPSFVLDDDLIISEIPHRVDRSTVTPSMNSVSASYIGGTPNGGMSRDASSVPRSSSKRPAPEVIDLTLDSDDEDSRPAKRPNYGDAATRHSYHGYHGNGNPY